MEDVEKVAEIKQQLEQGEYWVEPDAVADAVLRKLRELAAARREQVDAQDRAWAAKLESQIRCSYPESAPSASRKTAPRGPDVTRPTKVSSTWAGRVAHSISTTVRALGGTLTQSS